MTKFPSLNEKSCPVLYSTEVFILDCLLDGSIVLQG